MIPRNFRRAPNSGERFPAGVISPRFPTKNEMRRCTHFRLCGPESNFLVGWNNPARGSLSSIPEFIEKRKRVRQLESHFQSQSRLAIPQLGAILIFFAVPEARRSPVDESGDLFRLEGCAPSDPAFGALRLRLGVPNAASLCRRQSDYHNSDAPTVEQSSFQTSLQ